MTARLEELVAGASVNGIVGGEAVTVLAAETHGQEAVTLTYRRPSGEVGSELVYRTDEARLDVNTAGQRWTFDADAALFRLAAEARRVRLAHLFDPRLAVHLSRLDPLPHQIQAVYGAMLPRHPLRFALCDDPGAGKTIMAGLYIKELLLRGDVRRCLIVAPGGLVAQWQDEMSDRFGLTFAILTRDMIEASATADPFAEHDLLIARLDHLSRNDELVERLRATEWDLTVVDEAHRMSAHRFGGEVKETRRYRLGKVLAEASRHFNGQGGSPVVDLQTSFGGGKTHSMIALYHLCSGTPLDRMPQEVQDLVSAASPSGLPEVAAVWPPLPLPHQPRRRPPAGPPAGRCVFLGSAPRAGSPNQGLDAARVRLGSVMPGETVAIYGDALSRLADRATYFYVGSGRYWYGTQPGVTRLARDRAERLVAGARLEVQESIEARLRGLDLRRTEFAGVHAAPSGPADVADEPSTRLVILGPSTPHRARSVDTAALQLAHQILDQRGAGPRDFRNMLVFLAADERVVADLEQAEAENLAWASVVAESDALGLSRQQEDQAKDRSKEAKSTVELRLVDAYQWLLVPRQPEPTQPPVWDEVKVDGTGSLAERAGRKLAQTGGLYVSYPPVLLRLNLDGPLAPLWENGAVSVNQLWDAYARYLYLHRLRDVGVLLECVANGPASTVWASEGFAVAEAADPRQPGRYAGLVAGAMAPPARGTTLLVEPTTAGLQLESEREPAGVGAGSGLDVAEGPPGSKPMPPTMRRFYGAVPVDPDRLGRDAGRIAQEVVAHLQGLVGTETEVTIEIRASSADGFPDAVVKVVSENAAALRFTDHGFESS